MCQSSAGRPTRSSRCCGTRSRAASSQCGLGNLVGLDEAPRLGSLYRRGSQPHTTNHHRASNLAAGPSSPYFDQPNGREARGLSVRPFQFLRVLTRSVPEKRDGSSNCATDGQTQHQPSWSCRSTNRTHASRSGWFSTTRTLKKCTEANRYTSYPNGWPTRARPSKLPMADPLTPLTITCSVSY